MTRFSRAYAAVLAEQQAVRKRSEVELKSRPQEFAKRKPATVPPTGDAPGAVASRRKYGNTPTDGFGSKKEARRAAFLMQLEANGLISNLRCQVEYLLIPRQLIAGKVVERACTYTADFVYLDGDNQVVVEDVKGFPNDRWPIKRKLMLFVHGIRVMEV